MTTIKAEIANLPSNFIEYKGNYFQISKTLDGKTADMSKEELALSKERIKVIIDEALSNSTIDINKIEAFDFNYHNHTFYAFDHKSDLFNGSSANQIVKIKQATIDSLEKLTEKPEKIKPSPIKEAEKSNGTEKPSDNRRVDRDEDIYSAIMRGIISSVEDPKAQVTADSINAFTKILSKKYNKKDDNKIVISDSITVQGDKHIQPIEHLIDTFNSDPNINSIYVPLHVGSYPGYQGGHWICLAMTRQLGNPKVIIYDSMGGKRESIQLAEHIRDSIRADEAIVSDAGITHQSNAIDCGIHVLNFIKTMENTKFRSLHDFLDYTKPKDSIAFDLRKEIVEALKDAAKDKYVLDYLFGSGMSELERLKYYHKSLDLKKFVGAVEVKKIHMAQLECFKKNKEKIRKMHFDWWTFPIKAPSDSFKNLYALDDQAVRQLSYDDEFMRSYLENAQLVLEAYGWKLKRKGDGYEIKPYGREVRRIPEIRLSKMAESFYLFNDKLYDALVQLSEDQPAIGDTIGNPRTEKAFSLKEKEKENSSWFGGWFSRLNPFS